MTPRTGPARPWPTVILIRHADVTPGAGDDPPLNAAGTVRAQELTHVLGDAGIAAIYVTSLRRTKATSQPLAAELALQPIVEDDPVLLVEAIHARAGTTTVLVVGHTNTIPDVIARLGGDAVAPIAATEFDRLLVLSSGRICTLRYG